jgi:hypothetical protein
VNRAITLEVLVSDDPLEDVFRKSLELDRARMRERTEEERFDEVMAQKFRRTLSWIIIFGSAVGFGLIALGYYGQSVAVAILGLLCLVPVAIAGALFRLMPKLMSPRALRWFWAHNRDRLPRDP